MEQFLDLIHDGRYQHQMSNKILHEYCEATECQSEERSFYGQVVEQFAPGVFRGIAYQNSTLSWIAFLGNICSMIVVGYLVLCLLVKICRLVKVCRDPTKTKHDVRNLMMPSFFINSAPPPTPQVKFIPEEERTEIYRPKQVQSSPPSLIASINDWDSYREEFFNRNNL